MAKRIASNCKSVLASSTIAGGMGRGPRLLLHGEHHHIPFAAVVGPLHDLGMMWDQSLPLWNFHSASGPPARIGAGMVSQIAFAAGKLL